jgi:hypothetical protein
MEIFIFKPKEATQNHESCVQAQLSLVLHGETLSQYQALQQPQNTWTTKKTSESIKLSNNGQKYVGKCRISWGVMVSVNYFNTNVLQTH